MIYMKDCYNCHHCLTFNLTKMVVICTVNLYHFNLFETPSLYCFHSLTSNNHLNEYCCFCTLRSDYQNKILLSWILWFLYNFINHFIWFNVDIFILINKNLTPLNSPWFHWQILMDPFYYLSFDSLFICSICYFYFIIIHLIST